MHRKTMILSMMTSLVFLIVTASMASSGAFPQMKKTDEGVTFVSGGVGIDERNEMEKLSKDYNLKLIFANLMGDYLSGVELVIQDASGNRIVDTKTEGPWFFAKLPPREYRIISLYRDQKKIRTVTVDQGLTTAMFHWKRK